MQRPYNGNTLIQVVQVMVVVSGTVVVSDAVMVVLATATVASVQVSAPLLP